MSPLAVEPAGEQETFLLCRFTSSAVGGCLMGAVRSIVASHIVLPALVRLRPDTAVRASL